MAKRSYDPRHTLLPHHPGLMGYVTWRYRKRFASIEVQLDMQKGPSFRWRMTARLKFATSKVCESL